MHHRLARLSPPRFRNTPRARNARNGRETRAPPPAMKHTHALASSRAHACCPSCNSVPSASFCVPDATTAEDSRVVLSIGEGRPGSFVPRMFHDGTARPADDSEERECEPGRDSGSHCNVHPAPCARAVAWPSRRLLRHARTRVSFGTDTGQAVMPTRGCPEKHPSKPNKPLGRA